MQINGLGNSQSGDMRYRNNRAQYQNASDKTADHEESVILTLSSEAVEESKKATAVKNEKPKEEAVSSDWLQQLIQRVKAFFVKIWNEDSPEVINAKQEPLEASRLTEETKQEVVDTTQSPFAPILEVIKRFLANPFSDEPIIPGKTEQTKAQSQQTSFAEYAAANGWDEDAIAHQMQMKSQVWDTYNKKGEHSRMTREVPSNLSVKQ